MYNVVSNIVVNICLVFCFISVHISSFSCAEDYGVYYHSRSIYCLRKLPWLSLH